MKYFEFFVKVKLNIALLFLTLGAGLLTLTLPIYGSSGKYLVASQAAGYNDFGHAAKNYLSILGKNKLDPVVIQEALIFSVLANDFDSVWLLSEVIEKHDFQIPSAGLVALAKSFKDEDLDKVQGLLKKYEKSLPKFLIKFAHGWSQIANGDFRSGIKTFTKLDGTMHYLALYNCALANAMKGDFTNALFYLDQLEGKKLQFNERQLIAQAQIYSNNEENGKAILILESENQKRNDNLFGKELRELKSGKQLKFDTFKKPSDALASIFYLMGGANDEKNQNVIASIFYIQLAEFMSGKKDYYNVRLAETFAGAQAFNYSIRKYKKVPNESIFYLRAQLGIVDTLVELNQNENATEVLQNLIRQGFNEFALFDTLADIFRAKEDYETAIKYYDRALGNFDKEIRTNKWATFFVRGIAHDQSGNWEKAKVDLSTALSLYPNHPEVLNYFGYSLIERNESLDKALGMIEDAVLQKPDSGYILLLGGFFG